MNTPNYSVTAANLRTQANTIQKHVFNGIFSNAPDLIQSMLGTLTVTVRERKELIRLAESLIDFRTISGKFIPLVQRF